MFPKNDSEINSYQCNSPKFAPITEVKLEHNHYYGLNGG